MKRIKNSLKLALSTVVLSTLAMGGTGCDIHNNDDVAGLPKNNKVVILGDSIFALSGEIKEFLALSAGENYRGYAKSGAQMNGQIFWGLTPVPKQYTKARNADSNIRTIIMDGGGNDVLLGARSACEPMSTACEAVIDDVADTLEGLFNTMNGDGVENVIYLGYYHLPRGNAGLNPALDHGMTVLAATCDGSSVACHFVDARPLFLGNEEAWVKSDNIHPNRTGSHVLANGIWSTMEQNGIEQNGNLLLENAAQ